MLCERDGGRHVVRQAAQGRAFWERKPRRMVNSLTGPSAADLHKIREDANQKDLDRLSAFESETRRRVDTLIKALFVLSGGALTISIGIFLRPEAPQLLPWQIRCLQWSWGLIFYSLAAPATLMLIMIIQGYWQARTWGYREHLREGAAPRKLGVPWWRTMQSLRKINWVIGLTGFVAFLVGLGLLALVSVSAVTLPRKDVPLRAQASIPRPDRPAMPTSPSGVDITSAAPAASIPATLRETWFGKADWWTAIGTFALVGVAGGQLWLFLVQLRYIRQSIRDARVAADAARDSATAAKLSADIDQKMQRAFVTVAVIAPELPLASEGREWTPDGRTRVTVGLTLHNHGRTPAIIRIIDAGLRPLDSTPAEPLSFPDREHVLPPALAIAASGSYPLTIGRILNRSTWENTVNGQKKLFCGGTIAYDDVLNQRHATAFCWERSSANGGPDSYSITYSEKLNYFT